LTPVFSLQLLLSICTRLNLRGMQKSLPLIAVAVCLVCGPVHAQMAHRLKGSLRTNAGAAIAGGSIRADAIYGFRGEQFTGAREHSTTTNGGGEWNITGIEAGLWLFSSSAPDTIPAAIIIPVKFSQRQQVSAIGNSLTWQLPMFAYPAADHPMLKAALELLNAGKKDEAAQALTVALGPEVPTETRVAAGELAMLLQQAALAKTIFAMVLQKEPKHARAMLGAGGAALLAREWEAAGKIIWDARDLVPKEQRQALAAAIDDLRAIMRVQ
jgi:hypothetical protein